MRRTTTMTFPETHAGLLLPALPCPTAPPVSIHFFAFFVSLLPFPPVELVTPNLTEASLPPRAAADTRATNSKQRLYLPGGLTPVACRIVRAPTRCPLPLPCLELRLETKLFQANYLIQPTLVPHLPPPPFPKLQPCSVAAVLAHSPSTVSKPPPPPQASFSSLVLGLVPSFGFLCTWN